MKTTILFILTFFSLSVLSQNLLNEVPKNSKCLKITSFNIVIRPIMSSGVANQFSDLKRIILKKDPFIPMPTDDYYQSVSQPSIFNFNMELGLSSNSRPNRELLIGIGYVSGNRRSFEFSKYSNVRVDTLHVKDYTFYVDSFYHSSLKYSENVQEMDMNVSCIYKSDQDRKFSVFAGYGINVGYSTYSGILFSSAKDSTESLKLKNGQSNDNQNFNNDFESKYYMEERMVTDPSFFFRAYIPFGFNLKCSKTNLFWKHVNLQFQAQFGMEYRNISNDISYMRVYWSIGGLGLKFSF